MDGHEAFCGLTVYLGFGEIYAAIQTPSFSRKALLISARQYETAYCNTQHGFVVDESRTGLSPTKWIWHETKDIPNNTQGV